MTSVSFALASDDQLLLFSEEFTQILSSWAAKWVSGVVIVVELIKLYYLAAWQWVGEWHLCPSNILFSVSAIGVKALALAIWLQRGYAIKWKVNWIGGVLLGGAERQDVPMTQSLNAVSTLAQDHRNIETHPNTVCVLHSVTQHSVNTNTRSQRVIYQHIETQYHRVCTTQSQHEDNIAHSKTFSPKQGPFTNLE